MTLAGATGATHAEPGFADPEFARVPFARWIAQGGRAQIRWTVEIPPVELSTHQRLRLRVAIRVDEKEAAKRRAQGTLMALVQVRDRDGRLWQRHQAMGPGQTTLTEYAFVLPGDYSVTAALCDTATMEHSLTSRSLHVAAPKNDPLPGAWRGLATVEFIGGAKDSPDVWYLPEVDSGLRLSLRTTRRIHLRLLVNATPVGRNAGSLTALRRDMSVLLPAMKVFSQIEMTNGSLDLQMLDLTHRRVAFEQPDLGRPDWNGMRGLFLGTRPGIVDVETLRGQWKLRQFFSDTVTGGLKGGEGAVNAVIALSGPAFLEDQEPTEPATPAEGAEGRLFYIRCRVPPQRPVRPRVRPGMRPPPVPPATLPTGEDDLERTAASLGGRVYDAASAEELRRILAAVLEQLSRF